MPPRPTGWHPYARARGTARGHVWRRLDGSLSFEACGKGATLVRIEMEGRTKALVPEFTIKGPMQEQIEQMADALRRCIESA